MKPRSKVVFGALIFALCFRIWLYWKPDRFFSDLSLNVPANFIVSHRSPFWLLAIEDQLVLKIPTPRVAGIQKSFAAQKHFEDVSTNLPRYYAGFCTGEEALFPKHCPTHFQAGRFQARDHVGEIYICRFLFDRDDANFTYLYLSSISPTN